MFSVSNFGFKPAQPYLKFPNLLSNKARAHPRSCAEIKKRGGTTDGVYTIDPDGKGAFKIFCEQDNAGEAWAVIQRRQDGSVDFYRRWEDYKRGFGNLNGTFWLGLEKIHRMSNQRKQQKLRVELEDFAGKSCYAEYDNFTLNGEDDKYRLARLGFYQGIYVLFSLQAIGGICFPLQRKSGIQQTPY